MGVDAIANMKLQVISDFNKYLLQLNIGHKTDYSKILHKISFIQTYSYLDKIDPVYEYLTNN